MSFADDFDLSRTEAHLNHGSFGAVPRVVRDKQDLVRLEMARNPHRFFSVNVRNWLHEQRLRLAEEFGGRGDEYAFARNVTEGVAAIAASIELVPGDVVVTTNHEYGCLLDLWGQRCKETGAHLEIVSLSPTDPSCWAEVLASRMPERTKLVFVSHVTSDTSLLSPVRDIATLARQRGALTIVDGAHVPGHVELDVETIGADAYVADLHKWAFQPHGSAFVHATGPLRDVLRPLPRSWHYTSTHYADRMESVGTHDCSAWLATSSASDYRRSIEEAGGYDHARLLASSAADELEASGLEILGTPATRAPQMFSAVVDGSDAEALKQHLRSYGIWAWTGSWARRTLLRVSCSIYNDFTDVNRLLRAVSSRP